MELIVTAILCVSRFLFGLKPRFVFTQVNNVSVKFMLFLLTQCFMNVYRVLLTSMQSASKKKPVRLINTVKNQISRIQNWKKKNVIGSKLVFGKH